MALLERGDETMLTEAEILKFIEDDSGSEKKQMCIRDSAISGQMKQKQSALYDPMSNNSICINGQLLLLDLVEHVDVYKRQGLERKR